MAENTRLAGHNLAFEGAPFDETGQRIWHPYGATYGEGQARCSCGVLSEVLPSASARKRWHRAHKDALRTPAPRAEGSQR